MSEDGRIPPIPAIASHDEKRIEFALSYTAKIGLPKDLLEFQMLYGIRRDLQEKLAKQGISGAHLCSFRHPLVSIFHAPSGGTSRQYLVLCIEFLQGVNLDDGNPFSLRKRVFLFYGLIDP